MECRANKTNFKTITQFIKAIFYVQEIFHNTNFVVWVNYSNLSLLIYWSTIPILYSEYKFSNLTTVHYDATFRICYQDRDPWYHVQATLIGRFWHCRFSKVTKSYSNMRGYYKAPFTFVYINSCCTILFRTPLTL